MTQAPLRVLIDGSILKPQLAGIATYILELTDALARREDIEVALATSIAGELALPPSVTVIELPRSVRGFAARTVWRERELAGLLTSSRADVLIAPTVELPFRRLAVPTIMVVHDIVPVLAPQLYGRLRWLRFRAGIPIALRRADHVVCVSHATLRALIATFPNFAATCSVVGEAPRTLPHCERAPRTPPYVLHVGALLAHKNVGTLIRAMNEPSLEHVELLLSGPLTERERAQLHAWRSGVVRPERIKHLGFVDRDTLADLYAGAAVVAAPSLSEGFGLPVLEAMSCGAPVVASSIAAHREVGGDAVLYVEQFRNPAAWAAALARVVNDQASVQPLSRAACERADSFSWDGVATQFATLARSLARS
jgi:glycosyltransferase involved in cell wall biosynthesis